MSNQSYLAIIGKVIPECADTLAALEDEWKPDTCPQSLQYAAVGREIAERFNSLKEEQVSLVMQAIEEGISDSDIELSTLMATGLIEAMASGWLRTAQNTDLLFKHLQPNSAEYLSSWLMD